MSCCLLRTGSSTQRPTPCPSCTWATSPCLAARPSGRVDSPRGRPPPHSSLLCPRWRRGENFPHVPQPPSGLKRIWLQWTEETQTDLTLFIYASHIFSEGHTAGSAHSLRSHDCDRSTTVLHICTHIPHRQTNTIGMIPWLSRQNRPSGWMCDSHWEKDFGTFVLFCLWVWQRFVLSAQC